LLCRLERIKIDTQHLYILLSETYSSDNSTLIASSLNYQPTFNTIEKIVELYERLLASEREKNELLKKL